jgi:peptide-methionine (R)-S-oxide reductase
MDYPVQNEEQWKKRVREKRDIVYWEKRNRTAWTYNLHYEQGTYCCGACAEPLKVILNLMLAPHLMIQSAKECNW